MSPNGGASGIQAVVAGRAHLSRPCFPMSEAILENLCIDVDRSRQSPLSGQERDKQDAPRRTERS